MIETINHLNGLAFEERVYNYLKTIFTEVEWTSKKFTSSPYDFICHKGTKVFYGDAKLKAIINNSKVEVLDFIIIPEGDNFRIIYKDEFSSIPNSNSTTIKVKKDTLEKMNKCKRIDSESSNSIISFLCDFYLKSK